MGEPLREGLVNPERKAIRLITNQKSKKPQTRAEGCALNKKRWIDVVNPSAVQGVVSKL